MTNHKHGLNFVYLVFYDVDAHSCRPELNYFAGKEVEILLVASCYRNWDKLWPIGPLGSCADPYHY